MAPSTTTTTASGEKTQSKSDAPTMSHMVENTIISLKKRGGSSRTAIKKQIITNYHIKDDNHLKSRLSIALRKLVKDGKLEMVKASYKMNKTPPTNRPMLKDVRTKLADKSKSPRGAQQITSKAPVKKQTVRPPSKVIPKKKPVVSKAPRTLPVKGEKKPKKVAQPKSAASLKTVKKTIRKVLKRDSKN